MQTSLVYFDETGDDGLIKSSSDTFILTSIYMYSENWQKNYNQMKWLRKELKDKYGFYIKEEMHTKYFLTDKDPYRKYNWTKEQKLEILKAFTLTIAEMELHSINVIIDKKFIGSVLATLKKSNTLNLNANKSNSYGLVIYPK